MLNGSEIIHRLKEVLSENLINIKQFLYEDLDEEEAAAVKAAVGSWVIVDDERDDEIYRYVVKFTDNNNVCLEFDGDYDSWNGTQFDDVNPFEVVQATKTVQYWKKVQ